jgi:hypothetical protein
LRWVNYFGDPGLLKIGPFKSAGEASIKGGSKFEIDLDVIASAED